MPRGERPLDEGDSVLLRFAGDLRRLRQTAGSPPYRVLAEQVHYSVAALSEAANGRKLPSLAVALAYVRACDGDVEEWEGRWRAAVAELAPVPAELDRASDGLCAPYVGLAAFETADADRFFGRERLVAQLKSRLERRRFVAVFGASGAGKSSLLRAGLLPNWRAAGQHRPVVLFTPGPDPVEELAVALARLAGGMPGSMHTELAGDRRGLHRVARQLVADRPDDTDLVVVVDQFEEVFTLCREVAERTRFIDVLINAAQATNSRCRVVLGVRADFYTHCTSHPDLVDALNQAQFTMGPMTTDELRQAITQPAVRSGHTVESALLTDLVAQASGQVGVLPMLSHALVETWRRRRGNTLTLAGYQAAGGIDGALAQTAESLYAQLSARQQQMAKNLLLRLTALGEGTEDTKRRVARTELAEDADTSLVLDHLVRARLIVVDEDSLEISHEALIRSWPRLRDWLAEDREGLRLHRDLTEATGMWESLDRDHGALYRGVRLERAQEWARRHRAALAERERDFLDASLDAKQAEARLARRRGRRLLQTVVLLSVLLVLAVVATTYAISAQRSTDRQRRIALSQTVASKATTLRRSDPALAAQLSLAAYRLAPTAEARASVLAVFPFPYRQRLSGHTGNLNSVAFSPDSRTLVTTSHDRTALLWDVADPRRPTTAAVLTTHTGTVNDAAFRPDGQVLATAGWDRTAKLWNVSEPRRPVELATLAAHTDHVNAVAFSADGRVAVTVSTDRTAKLWDVADPRNPRLRATLPGHTDGLAAAAFRPDGKMLATASFDHTIGLWDLTTPGRPATFLTGHRAAVTWVAFSPDGTTLASASQDGTARIWDPDRGTEIGTLAGHDSVIRSVMFSPDGHTAATAAEDATARLWDLSGPGAYRQIARLDAHTERLTSVAFSPDGQTMATASDDDTAMLWKMPGTRPDQIDIAEAEKRVCGVLDAPISSTDWATYLPGIDYQPPCGKSN